jgi:hypothetical protein
MSLSLRLAACAALVGLAFIGILFLQPAVFEASGLSVSDGPKWLSLYVAQTERGRELRQRIKAVEGRLWQQARICQDLIDGRITLAEATQRFDELPDPPENLHEQLRRYFVGATHRERLARSIIHWACEMLADQPDRVRELRLRWEGELTAATESR